MILDCNGTPLRRSIGFISGWVPVRKALPLVDALYLVGLQVEAEAEEEEASCLAVEAGIADKARALEESDAATTTS